MRKVNLIIFLFCISMGTAAQSKDSITTGYVGSFSFRQFLGGVIMLEAKLDTISVPLNFILDTGSGGISLDSTTCEEFNIKTSATDTVLSAIGGLRKVRFAFNRNLEINGIRVDSLNFHINDYAAFARIYGIKIDGIIGYSFFRRYIVKIDYDEKKIHVYKPGVVKYPKKGELLHPRMSTLAMQRVEIRDDSKIEFPFYFDTGAGLALLVSKKFAQDSSVLRDNSRRLPIGVQGLLGRTDMQITVIKKMKIGKYRFRKLPTYIYNDAHNVTGYPRTGGLIGSELFRRFNLIINYGQQEIHIQPNSHFNDPFDYGYTGMLIYYEDEKIIIDEIIKNSPADKAGLRVGDQLVSVGKNISMNIESYQTDLQVPNQLYNIVIIRDDKLEKLALKTGSIL